MKAKCNRCGVELDEIRFCYPLSKGESWGSGEYRLPLCEPCWNIVYTEMYGHKYGQKAQP